MTVLTQRAGTAMTDAGRVQNAQGPVALRSAFLHKERMESLGNAAFRPAAE